MKFFSAVVYNDGFRDMSSIKYAELLLEMLFKHLLVVLLIESWWVDFLNEGENQYLNLKNS